MQKRKPDLPDSARQLYELLYGDMVTLNLRWKMYKELFSGPPARISLLTKTAPVFFGNLGRILVADITLGITRLSDPARRGNFENLSLARLAEEFSAAEFDELIKLLRLRLKSIESKCAPFRKHRDKHVAHRDLQTAVAPHEVALPKSSKKDTEAAIMSLNGFLNDIAKYCNGLVCVGYEHVLEEPYKSTDGLIWALKKSVALNLLLDPMEHGKIIAETEFGDA